MVHLLIESIQLLTWGSLFEGSNFAPLSSSVIEDSERSPVDCDELVLLDAADSGDRKWEYSLTDRVICRLHSVVIGVKNQTFLEILASKSA